MIKRKYGAKWKDRWKFLKFGEPIALHEVCLFGNLYKERHKCYLCRGGWSDRRILFISGLVVWFNLFLTTELRDGILQAHVQNVIIHYLKFFFLFSYFALIFIFNNINIVKYLISANGFKLKFYLIFFISFHFN